MFNETRIIRGFDVIAPLFETIQGLGFICGGYARFCASPTVKPAPAQDVDVYCYTDADFEVLSAKIKVDLKVKVETVRAISFETSMTGPLAFVPPVQLIKPVKQFRMVTVGSETEVIDNFDFSIVRAALLSHDVALVDEDFHADEMDRRLNLKNIHCPISSTLRCIKYVERGYNLAPYDALKLFLDWDGRDATYRAELIEGVTALRNAKVSETKLSQERLDAIYDLLNVD